MPIIVSESVQESLKKKKEKKMLRESMRRNPMVVRSRDKETIALFQTIERSWKQCLTVHDCRPEFNSKVRGIISENRTYAI